MNSTIKVKNMWFEGSDFHVIDEKGNETIYKEAYINKFESHTKNPNIIQENCNFVYTALEKNNENA